MLSSDPLVSVIIPCYNYGRYLNEALESINAQTYTHWECIVVDDGSTDNTREVGNRYAEKDKRFKYIYQPNGGVSNARNTALKKAAGKYVQFLDADDLVEQNKLKLQVELLEENPAIDLIYSSIIFFKKIDSGNDSSPQLLLEKMPVSGSGEKLLNSLVDDNLFLPGCVLCRKALYEQIGGFRAGIEGIEDWEFFYRAALIEKFFQYDPREGTRLLARSHDTNASNNSHRMLTHKLKAREVLMQLTADKAGILPPPGFSNEYLQRVYKAHKGLFNRDAARLHLFYGNLVKGCLHIVKHAWFSKRYYFSFYDGGYWIKERIKKKLKAISSSSR